MKYIGTLLSLLVAISCSVSHADDKPEAIDTVVIEYPENKDTLIIVDTLVVKKNAKNLWTPKCVAYMKWRLS